MVDKTRKEGQDKMPTDALFHWVVLNQDIPNTLVKAGDRAVIVDRLPATAKQPERVLSWRCLSREKRWMWSRCRLRG